LKKRTRDISAGEEPIYDEPKVIKRIHTGATYIDTGVETCIN
jgi:hypothetical protein